MKAVVLAVCLVLALAAVGASARGLYGLTYPPQLVSVDVSSGVVTNIGARISNEGMAQELTTIDSKGNVLYFIGFNFTTSKANVIGVALGSGAIITKFDLPFAESAFVGVGQAIDFDPNTGDLICTGRLTAEGAHSVMRVNARTGQYKVVGSVDAGDVLGAATAFNPLTNVEYLEYATNDTASLLQRRMLNGFDFAAAMEYPNGNRVSIDLFGVDMKTGNVDHIIEDPSVGKVLTTLQFDPKSKTLVGLGYKYVSSKFVRTLERFDPVAKTWNQIGEITDYLIESGGVSALDVTGRVLYAIMQKANVPQSDPFYLVGFNIDTGKTVSSSLLCKNFPDCPWSLEFAN